MGFKGTKAQKKQVYDKRVNELLEEYNKALLCTADNVGSKQMQDIRSGLRPDSIVLMGKNTLLKRSIRMYCERTGNDAWKTIIPLLVGNVGLVFTKGDLKEVREEIAKYKVGAPARVGLVAPIDVIVPPGNTGLDPSQTNFFQVLNIPTKINKGTVEIIAPVELIKAGDKVGSSEAALLSKLNIRPFSYGLLVEKVYEDGTAFAPAVLDMEESELLKQFLGGLGNVAALALATHYPTLVAVPHTFVNGFKNVVAVALGLDGEYSFPQADKIKEILADPTRFLVAAAPVAEASAAAEETKEEAKPVEEEKEESDDDMGFSLFD